MATTIFHTTHVTLMRKVAGRNLGTFLAGSPAVIEKTNEFASTTFGRYTDGSYMKVTFRVSGDRRYFVGAEQLDGYNKFTVAEAIVKFWNDNGEDILKQAVRFFRKVGGEKVSYMVLGSPNWSRIIPLATFNDYAIARIKETTADYELLHDMAVNPSKYVSVHGSLAGEAAVVTEEPVVAEPKAKREPRMRNINAMVEVNGIVAKNGDWHLFSAMKAIADVNVAANILLVGPSGCGKTSMPEAFAAENGMNFLRMNCATIRDPEEWIGYREARDGSTVFVKSEFIKAVEQGNTMIVLDEFNRVEPWLHNTLFPLLDHGRKTVAHNEEVKVGNGTIFAATANIGGKFTGTFMLDAALTNRFDATVQMGYLPEEQESKVLCERTSIDCEDAGKIVSVIRTLRAAEKQLELGIDLSIRTSLKVATVWKHSKLPMMAIIDRVVLSAIQDDNVTKKLIDAVAPVVKNLFEE